MSGSPSVPSIRYRPSFARLRMAPSRMGTDDHRCSPMVRASTAEQKPVPALLDREGLTNNGAHNESVTSRLERSGYQTARGRLDHSRAPRDARTWSARPVIAIPPAPGRGASRRLCVSLMSSWSSRMPCVHALLRPPRTTAAGPSRAGAGVAESNRGADSGRDIRQASEGGVDRLGAPR